MNNEAFLLPLLATAAVFAISIAVFFLTQREVRTQRAAWHRAAPTKKVSGSLSQSARKVLSGIRNKKFILNVSIILLAVIVLGAATWWLDVNIDRIIPRKMVHTLSITEIPYEPVEVAVLTGGSTSVFPIPGSPTNPVRWRPCVRKHDDVSALYQYDRFGNPVGVWFENRSQETRRVRVVMTQTTTPCTVALQ